MPSLDYSTTVPDEASTPAKSFFFHSPPDSPVNAPSNPFSQITGTISSIANKATSPDTPKHSKRPSTSDGHNRTSRFFNSKRVKQNGDQSWQLDADPFAPSRSSVYSNHFSTHSQPNVSLTLPRSETKKRHGSMLFVNSDGLFSRSKSKLHRPTQHIITETVHEDVVLDISAEQQRRLEKEREDALERERLREAAARSIGLENDEQQPTSHPEEQSPEVEEATGSEDVNDGKAQSDGDIKAESLQPKTTELLPRISIEPTTSNGTTRPPSFTNSQISSTPLTPPFKLPNFPASHSDLSESFILSGTLPRYTPPISAFSHLLGRSKVWKLRLVCLTSVAGPSRANASFLHVFKNPTASPDNLEIDRLEINEDSVVFVADEDVGGRKHVLRIGGVEVGSGSPKKANHVQMPKGLGQGMTIWFFHLENQVEMQQWISAIKTIVLERRADAAGLGFTSSPLDSPHISSQGPGDLDVALRLRAQDLYISSPLPPISPVSPLNPHIPYHLGEEKNISETQSVASDRPTSRASAVSILRGFFSSSTLPIITSSNKAHHKSPSHGDVSSSRDNEVYRASGLRAMFRQSAALPAKSTHRRSPSSKLETHKEEEADESMKLTFAAPPSPGHSQEHLPSSTTGSVNGEKDMISQERGLLMLTEDPVAVAVTPPQRPSRDRTSNATIASFLQSPDEQEGHVQETSENRVQSTSLPSSSRRESKEIDQSSSSRVRYSTALPEMLAPPSGPLPRPPSNTTDTTTSVSGSARSSTQRYSKRISNTSITSTFSSRSSNASRLSTLFAGRVAPVSGARSSMPPPPRPMPTFAPPPVPWAESADATLGTFSQTEKRKTGSTSNRSSQVSVEKLPPLALPPSGPLPPIPATESETDLTAKPPDRVRLMSAPSTPTPSTQHKVDHPFGRRGSPSQHGGTFLDPFTPNTTPKAEESSYRHPQDDLVPIPLSPPPRRTSRQVSLSRSDGPNMVARRAATTVSIRSSAVIL